MNTASMEAGPATSRAELYDWYKHVNATNDSFDYEMPRLAIDSADNVHFVFLNETENITYLKMDPDQQVVDGPRTIGRTNMTFRTPPTIAVDGNDDIHISVIDFRPGGPMEWAVYYPRHFMIDGGTGSVIEHNNTGGDRLLIDSNDFVYGLQFYRYGGSNPPLSGPIKVRKMDGAGGEVWSKEIGNHQLGYYIADWVVTKTDDIIIVLGYGDKTLTFFRLSSAGATEVNGISLDTNITVGTERVADVSMAIDDNETIHIFYNVDDTWDTPQYIRHMMTDVDGTISYNEIVVAKTESRRNDLEVAGPDAWGTIGILYASGPDGGVWELGKDYRTKFVDTDGNIVKEQEDLLYACPDYEGDIAVNSTNAFHFVTDNRTCFQGQPSNDRSDLVVYYAISSVPILFDLSVVEADVSFPADIIQMDQFELNVTVRNLDVTNSTSDYTLILTYKFNSTEIANISMPALGPSGSVTQGFDLILNQTTDITIEVEPKQNRDRTLINNLLDITIPILERPKVSILVDDVTVEPSSVRIGSNVSISVPVENTGGLDASLVMRLEPLIMGDIPLDVTVGSKVWVNRTWSTMIPGLYQFKASLHDIVPAELPNNPGLHEVDLEVTVIDKTPPVVTIDVPLNGTVVPDRFFVNGTVTDAENDPVTIRIKLDDGQLPDTPIYDGTNFSWDLDLALQPYGLHDITVVGCDAYNCSEDTVAVILRYPELLAKIIDWTPKDHNVTMLENGSTEFGITTWTNSEFAFKYDWYFDTGRFSWSTPNWTYNMSSFQKGVEVGNHTVRVTATIAHIVLEMTWNLTVEKIVIPNSPPVFKLRTPTALEHEFDCKGGNVTIKLNVDDPDGELLEVSMYIRDKLISTKTDVNPGAWATFMVESKDVAHETPVKFVVSDGKDNALVTYSISNPPPGACGGTPPPKPHVDDYLGWPFWMALIIAIIAIVVAVILYLNWRKKGQTPASQEAPQPEMEQPQVPEGQQPPPPTEEWQPQGPPPEEGQNQ